MSPEESRLLNELLDRLARMPAGYKDPEADALIKAAMIRLPDATYQLVQASILQEQAAQGARARIEQLESELASARRQTAGAQPSPWGSGSVPQTGPQVMAQPASTRGSFLGNVAETAVGVAGGMLLAQGVSNLLGGHAGSPWGGSAWGASPWGGAFGAGAPTIVENTTINETINQTYNQDSDNTDFDTGDDFDQDSDFTDA